jgi:hypothetical protein
MLVIESLVAGLVMSVWMAAVDAIGGRGVWRTPELIGTMALGAGSYRGGRRFRPIPFAAGMLLHAGASIGLGLAEWSLLRFDTARRHRVVSAVAVSLGSWVIWQYAVMPWMAPKMNEESRPVELALADGVFGLALGLLANRRS